MPGNTTQVKSPRPTLKSATEVGAGLSMRAQWPGYSATAVFPNRAKHTSLQDLLSREIVPRDSSGMTAFYTATRP
jgi:hypothetical protein